MQYNPFMPIWMLIGAWIVSVVFIAVSYYRKLRGHEFVFSFIFMLTRLAAVTVVAIMLLRPQIETRKTEKIHSVLPILIDASESMAMEDQEGNLSRFTMAKDSVLLKLKEPLSKMFDLRLYTFGSYLEPQTVGSLADIPSPYGSSTDIGGALSNALRKEGRRVDAVIILSDGVHNLGTHPQDVAPVLAQEGTRVITVGIGKEGDYKDVEVGSVSVPDMVFMNEEVPVSFAIRSYGYRKLTAEVVLEGRMILDGAGQPKEGPKMILGSETVELSEKFPQQPGHMSFTLGDRGVYEVSLSVSEQEGERSTANNRKQVEINVARERMHVLFIEGRPRWGFGFLVRSLKSDPRLALHAITEVADGIFYQQFTGEDTPVGDGGPWEYPQTSLDLQQYDLLILGDVSPEKFGDKGLKAIAKAVSDRGMALIIIGGPKSLGPGGFADTALEKVLPVGLTGQSEETASPPLSYFLTPSGAGHPIFRMASDAFEIQKLMSSLPGLGAYWPLGKAKPAALVLMGAKGAEEQKPVLLAVQKYGKGRTAVMATDKWYLWSFAQLSGDVSGQTILQRFWQGFVRWIITGEEEEMGGLVINLEEEKVIQGKEMRVRVRYTSGDPSQIETPELRVYTPDVGEKVLSLDPDEYPGWFRANYQPSSLGNYKLVATLKDKLGETITAEKEFRVQPYVMEQRGAGMNEQLLRKLSADTNGKYYTTDQISEIPDLLPEVQTEVERLTVSPLWNSPWLYGLLFLVMSFEWVWRRLRDLP